VCTNMFIKGFFQFPFPKIDFLSLGFALPASNLCTFSCFIRPSSKTASNAWKRLPGARKTEVSQSGFENTYDEVTKRTMQCNVLAVCTKVTLLDDGAALQRLDIVYEDRMDKLEVPPGRGLKNAKSNLTLRPLCISDHSGMSHMVRRSVYFDRHKGNSKINAVVSSSERTFAIGKQPRSVIRASP
jgi:hypothetical protein